MPDDILPTLDSGSAPPTGGGSASTCPSSPSAQQAQTSPATALGLATLQAAGLATGPATLAGPATVLPGPLPQGGADTLAAPLPSGGEVSSGPPGGGGGGSGGKGGQGGQGGAEAAGRGLLSFSNNDANEPQALGALGLPGAPQKIGRFEIIKLLGEGGFGSVYLAEQRIPVRRKVALKVVKLGMDTAEVLQRFEAERQALALMDHPNVARVFDAGVTDRGQPFFAMEFVEGIPLNNYVDDNLLTLDQRLHLFIDICRAVQHAHGKGLIHRDLKPGNIIVSTVDGKPAPKVIDFGIAKATGPNLSDTNFRTETGRLIGTPEYMSPEQCSGSVDIDTRTDVYALGVILYELLTGQLPFDSKMLRAGGIDGITKIIREVEPQRPSARVTSLDIGKDAALLARIARTRKLDVRHLTRALKGDLDWIVLRALEKDRNRRYDTANALAMDVVRHLGNEPVSAGPPNLSYRLEKFARRNKVAFATLTAVAAALVLGVTFSTIGFVQASRARTVAEQQRTIAIEKQHLAEQRLAEFTEQSRVSAAMAAQKAIADARVESSNKFYEGLFSSIDPSKARGRDVTVRDVLDVAAARIDQHPPKSEDVEASLRSVFGSTLFKLGYAAKAEAQLRKALALATKPLVPDEALLFEIHNRLGLALRENGKADEAIEQLNQGLAMAAKKYGEQSAEMAVVLQNLGLVYEDSRRFPDAERYLRRALDILRARRDSNASIVRSNLANLYHSMGDLRSAELLFRDALREMEKAQGPDAPDTGYACRDLGLLLYDNGELQDASVYLSRAVGIWRKVLPPSHPDYRQVLDLLGDAETQLGQLDAAEGVIRESLGIRETYAGHDSAEALEALANLANIYQRRNQNEKALEFSTDILARSKRSLTNLADPAQAKLMASNLALHGTVLLDLGRPADAEPFVRQALGLREKLFGVGDWHRANTLSLLGAILSAEGNNAEAEARLVEAYTALEQDRNTPAITLTRARARLYKFYVGTNRPEKAAQYK